MAKIKIEFRGRCPTCKNERSILTAYVLNNASSFDAFEDEIDRQGSMWCRCPKCNAVEEVALFINNAQRDPWLDADEFERHNGPLAGPLPSKPWANR